ncbi:hypothetical protein GCM10010521_19630 [Streptomyces rameus]|uniref:Lipoprotein n=1 Tax=Streptomyces rameus TaxID=68261 RepID=A0ABP6N1W3_9ACTN
MKITTRFVPVAAALVCLGLTLVSCGTDHGGKKTSTTPAPGSSRPHREDSPLHAFRAYLTTKAPKADAAIAPHVTSVSTRTATADARSVAVVHVDYGVWEDAELGRTAKAFAQWRRTAYGDHGHVDVLAPAKMTAEQDW